MAFSSFRGSTCYSTFVVELMLNNFSMRLQENTREDKLENKITWRRVMRNDERWAQQKCECEV
jgi:hypothetical protein